MENFGVKNGRVFVNSAQGVGRDVAGDMFPYEEALDGSIALDALVAMARDYDPTGAPHLGELIFGRVAIRMAIEHLGFDVRGKDYTKRQANNMITQAGFFGDVFPGGGTSFLWTCTALLSNYVSDKYSQGRDIHKKNLEEARERRHA